MKKLVIILIVLVSVSLYSQESMLEKSYWAKEWGRQLSRAALFGDTDTVEFLINAKADINIQDKWGYTALIDATKEGYAEIVKLLIDAKAHLNIQNIHGNTALKLAVLNGSTEIIKLLVKAMTTYSYRSYAPQLADLRNSQECLVAFIEKMNTHNVPPYAQLEIALRSSDIMKWLFDVFLGELNEDSGYLLNLAKKYSLKLLEKHLVEKSLEKHALFGVTKDIFVDVLYKKLLADFAKVSRLDVPKKETLLEDIHAGIIERLAELKRSRHS